MSPHDDRTLDFVQRAWDGDIVPALTEYIRIPAKSPMFDAKWAEHGHIERAVTLITEWARQRRIEGLTLDVVRLEGRTPVLNPRDSGYPTLAAAPEKDLPVFAL